MFKKGDIVVRINTMNGKLVYPEHKYGAIWSCNIRSNRAYYSDNNCTLSKNVRLATENEIKWFNLGITNINQIPEVGGTFYKENDFDYYKIIEINNSTIKARNNNKLCYNSVDKWVKRLTSNYIINYKSPIKSNSEKDAMFGKEFTITDLNDCKIDNLTPEDNKIIQPFLFKLGYIWGGSESTTLHDSFKSIIVKKNKKLYSFTDYNKEIKKEVILNYINNQKQLNTNTNEVLRKTTEVTRRTINGTARMVSGRQQIATGSRLKGNIQRVKVRETQVRRFEISGKVRLR